MPSSHPIVGVWYARIFGAPFEYHMLTFHQDGTMTQSNPPAGNKTGSDSIGMGPWRARGTKVHAKFVEVTASHHTHQFMSRGEITLVLTLAGDTFAGSAQACFYDEHNNLVGGPTHEKVQGWRVTLDKPTPYTPPSGSPVRR